MRRLERGGGFDGLLHAIARRRVIAGAIVTAPALFIASTIITAPRVLGLEPCDSATAREPRAAGAFDDSSPLRPLDGEDRPAGATDTGGESKQEEKRAAELRFWLETMIAHRFSLEEMASATGLEAKEVEASLARFELSRDEPPRPPADRAYVLPYPGGRHPRIGFLDGAIDPHRDTKASVFLPGGDDAGYVVLDLPEAQWAKRGREDRKLIYLAHTHIPTLWDEKGIRLERIDWTRRDEGVLESRRVLPDGVAFATRIVPRARHVDLAMRIENGGKMPLSELRTQICVLLKGAGEFNATTNDNKIFDGEAAAVRSKDGRRWIVIAWERGKAWGNAPCPCLHADPLFPDLAPGEGKTLRGRLFFFEGEDVRKEIDARRKAGTLVPSESEIDVPKAAKK